MKDFYAFIESVYLVLVEVYDSQVLQGGKWINVCNIVVRTIQLLQLRQLRKGGKIVYFVEVYVQTHQGIQISYRLQVRDLIL